MRQGGRFLIVLGLSLLSLLFLAPFTLWLWSILPGRTVNAFYLRSFRNDPATWPCRKAAQAALGRRFRLSGIRDPRRRGPRVLRYMDVFLFAIRYCTPKFMNLEAGADWKARLWRSLGDARCALIDLSDLTPFVLEEIELCRRCLGLKRILFVGDSSRGPDAWRMQIAAGAGWLDPTLLPEIRVAIWNASKGGRKAFTASVRAFAAGLPAGVAGLKAEALPLAQVGGTPGEGPPSWGVEGGVEMVLGIALSFVLFGGFQLARLAYEQILGHPDVLIDLLWMLPSFAFLAIEVCCIVRYLIDCTAWERVPPLAFFSFLFCGVAVAFLLPDVQKVREAAARISCTNNLKQIGLAIHSYNDAAGALPAAAINDKSGEPLPSWSVAILPYIEQDNLYNSTYRDRGDNNDNRNGGNWASTDYSVNVKTFACPSDTTNWSSYPTGGIDYRAFAGNGAALDMQRGNSMLSLDGTSNTFFASEAPTPAPWTKPDELVYDPEKPLAPLGGHFPGGFMAGMADGSVHFIKQDIKQSTLRAAITPNGGEILDPDW